MNLALIGMGVGGLHEAHAQARYSRGEEMFDPATGLKLGSCERMIGSIQVTEVQEQFAVGVIQNATGAMKRGDRVKGP